MVVRKTTKKELIGKVQRLSQDGFNDSAISRQLKIHRSTVKKYRELAEKEDIKSQARIQVVRDALVQHFADLCQIVERMEGELRAPTPEYAIINEVGIPGRYSHGSVGGTAALSWRVLEDSGIELCISVEEDVLFNCLMQHTKRFELWKHFQSWKEQGGRYLVELFKLRRLITAQVEERTGMKVVATLDELGVIGLFDHSIYKAACGYAFSGNWGWKGIDYEIVSSKPRWFELRLGRTPLAASSRKDEMEHCLEVHRDMMEEYHSPDTCAAELIKARDIYRQLGDLENQMNAELKKMRLKRTFPGRCDICPD